MKKLKPFWEYLLAKSKTSRRIKENAKCPACGHRRGSIRFIPENKAIAHECTICFAIWGEPTVVDTEKWL